MNGIELIRKERREQLDKHDFSVDRDAEVNDEGQLKQAAIFTLTEDESQYPMGWRAFFLNNIHFGRKNQIEKLAIAGALIAAEIDRLLLLEGKFTHEEPAQYFKIFRIDGTEVLCEKFADSSDENEEIFGITVTFHHGGVRCSFAHGFNSEYDRNTAWEDISVEYLRKTVALLKQGTPLE